MSLFKNLFLHIIIDIFDVVKFQKVHRVCLFRIKPSGANDFSFTSHTGTSQECNIALLWSTRQHEPVFTRVHYAYSDSQEHKAKTKH